MAKLLLILIFAGALVDELAAPKDPPLLIDNGPALDAGN
jgi:hypothetical protein